MARLLIFISIVFAVLFVSCEKEDTLSSFAIVGDDSMDFNPGQTKQVGYTASHIRSYNDPKVPEGWSCVKQGDKYVITAPTSGGDMTGEISISARGDNDALITRKIAVAVRTAEDISDRRANSFIVTEPGKRFRFQTGGYTGNVKGERIWSTSKTAIVNVTCEDGYMYFATGAGADFEDANAVIGMMDADGNALWSWHLWVCREDPTEQTFVMGFGDGYEVMDRNLGAFSTAHDESSFGMYYQWGRKDPFAGPVALYDHKGAVRTYDFEVSSPEVGTPEYATAHPATFIAGAENDGYNWGFGGRPGEWRTAILNPCPAGWMVADMQGVGYDFFKDPTIVVSNDVEDFAVVGEYDFGWTFDVKGYDQGIFFPAAGRRSFSPGLATWAKNYTNIVNDESGEGSPVGFYWSCFAEGTEGGGGAVVFGEDYLNRNTGQVPNDDIAETALAGGFQVRCMKAGL